MSCAAAAHRCLSKEKTKRAKVTNILQISALLSIATKARRLAYEVSREPRAYRRAGTLCRLIEFRFSSLNEREVTAFAEAHIEQAKWGEDPLADDPRGFCLLQIAIAQVSYHLWEYLWNEKHPNQFGKAWEGEDFALMSIWRQKILATIKQCRQGAVLAMSPEVYIAKLIESGASEETATDLTEWLSEVKCGGTTPST